MSLCSVRVSYLTSPSVPAYTAETLLYMLFWGLMAYGTTAAILVYGAEFVQNPRLCPRRLRAKLA